MKITEHESIAREKLMEARGIVEVYGMDFDGTLVDGERFQKEDAISLIQEILRKGKTPVFCTARAATAVKTFVPLLQNYYSDNPDAIATYIGGGNGTVLYKLDGGGIERIYNHGLSQDEIARIVAAWEKYAVNNLKPADLSEKGVITFQKFYVENWDGLIPKEVLTIGRPYNGRLFTEESKVTFVLPQDMGRHEKVVSDLQKLVGDGFAVAAGDKDFCHITKRLHEDSKMVAVKTVLGELGLRNDQVATFGDMPHGNDKGLLSFPYSFTNYSEYKSQIKDVNEPPFILPEEGLPPVARVHNAIKYLLS